MTGRRFRWGIAVVAVAGLIGAVAATSSREVVGHRIWIPRQHTTWQWQLTTRVDLSVSAQMFDIGLFDNPASVVASLHHRGRKVVCYLDAGMFENFCRRPRGFPAIAARQAKWVAG